MDLGHDQDLASWPRPRSWILDTAKIKHTRNITNNSKHKSKTMYGQWGMGPPLREHEVVPTLREVVGLARGIFAHGQDLGPWILDLGHGPDPRSWILAVAKILDLGHDQDLASWPRPRSWIFATAKISDLGHGQDQTHMEHHKQ